MDLADLAARLGLALALGFVIGLERGWKERDEGEGKRTAGIRTFSLIGLLGGLFGALSLGGDRILLSAGFITTSAVMAAFVWRENLREGIRLMKEAGYEQGFKMSFISPAARYVNDAKIAQAVSAMLAKINIKVDLKTMPVAQYWPEFDKCAADMQLIGWHSDTEDSANFFEFLTFTKDAKTGMGQYNCAGYANAEADKLVEQANAETDATQLAVVHGAVGQRLDDLSVMTPSFVGLGARRAPRHCCGRGPGGGPSGRGRRRQRG